MKEEKYIIPTNEVNAGNAFTSYLLAFKIGVMASLNYRDDKIEASGDAPDVIKAIKVGYLFKIGFKVLAIVGSIVAVGCMLLRWYVITH